MKRNLILKRFRLVPIYNFETWFVIAHEPRKIAEKMKPFDTVTTEYPRMGHGQAFCIYSRGEFGVFFRANKLSSNDLAHEVRHCVDYMWDLIGHDPRPGDEPTAYLTGYLTEWLNQELRQAKIRICP